MRANRRPASPSPGDAALRRMADLVGRQATPQRLRVAVEDLVSEWRAETSLADRASIRERLEDMAQQLAEGIAEARQALDETSLSQATLRRHGEASLAALSAAHDALHAAQATL
ncbi:hypothetical protein [Pseudoroseomonas cervicalis]|uniref:hypothetical protein n=1 Tax=Teichococcus cervicalis TaxID=204525 RepID=UPI0027889777|nr:hypothetical protein [Pseudoroseomonas cervicalis]MDQ1079674.1 uncharacterized membrane protein YcjF (UPF0283 family) [Pseudoroseomonas cervicalis]